MDPSRDPALRADCTRCAALCCVALAFDRSPHFAFDKPAAVPCPNLTPALRCVIHEDLGARGFGGCARYECWGAGQRVTQEVFGGRSWQGDPQLAEAMFEAFGVMREVHELLVLLRAAKELPLAPAQLRARDALDAALDPAEGWSLVALRAFKRSPVSHEVATFLTTLTDAAKPMRHRLAVR
ncbi:MAG TPA: hypothetical protein VGI39_15235 [Polyangiaceae bacterium]